MDNKNDNPEEKEDEEEDDDEKDGERRIRHYCNPKNAIKKKKSESKKIFFSF